jgi:hypothetical protein
LPEDDEGGGVAENVDRIAGTCLCKPLISALPRLSLPPLIHALPDSPIIGVTALTGTRVMNRMSVEGGGAGPAALR